MNRIIKGAEGWNEIYWNYIFCTATFLLIYRKIFQGKPESRFSSCLEKNNCFS
jgi:hypothetical protein